ncbi:MAG: glyoxalase [Cyanobacteria bacterium P01_D01_bin.73]
MSAAFSYRDAFITLADTPNGDLVPFYRKLLGCAPDPYQPGRYAEFHPAIGPKLVIFQPQPSQIEQFQCSSSGALSLCWVVEDLEAAIATLTALGHPPSTAIVKASHGREIYASDPANNRLIFYQPKSLQ